MMIKKLGVLALGLLLSMPTLVFAQATPMQTLLTCIIGQQNVQRTLEGTQQAHRCIRDGTLTEIPWQQALALEGRVFTTNFSGGGVTGIAGKTTFTSGSPDANIDVPLGMTVIPVYVDLNITAATGTVNHFWVQVNGNLTGNGTSTAGPTVFNNRLGDQPFASRVTTRQQYTVAGTAFTNAIELFHIQNIGPVSATSATPWSWTYDFLTKGIITPVVGPASISLYSVATTTAASFQYRITWIEIPSSTIQ